ncbi:MAG: IS630 family transposase [Candidatus Dormibacteraceae bacterium]
MVLLLHTRTPRKRSLEVRFSPDLAEFIAEEAKAKRTRPRSLPRKCALRICLSRRECRILKRIRESSSCEQRLVLRATIILLVARRRESNKAIARKLGIDVHTVRKWIERFQSFRLDGLQELPRSGRPTKFTPEQRHQVIAEVLSLPPDHLTRWTLDELVDAVVSKGIAPRISRETISLWLRTAKVKPHRNRYWLNSKDPEFQAKMNRVVQLYLHPPQDGELLCLDEKTGIQALERKYPDLPLRRGRVRRLEFEYKRHGTTKLMAAFAVRTGRVYGECIESNDSKTFIAFVKTVMELYPKGKLYLILDNGSSHTSEETRAFFESQSRLVPVYLPTHGSWLNQIEVWFSVLSRQALKYASFPSAEALVQRILGYIERYNSLRAHPYRWSKKGRPLQD